MTAPTPAPFAAEIAALEAEQARLGLYPLTKAGAAARVTRQLDALKARAADYDQAQALAPVYAAAVTALMAGDKAADSRLSDLDETACELVSLSEWDSLTDAALAAL